MLRLVVLLVIFSFNQPVFAQAPTARPITAVTSAMTNAGVVFCQQRIQQVSDFLAGNASSSAALMIPPNHINDRLVSASMEVSTGSTVFYASMDFSPLVAYGCDASFETVSYWQNSCDLVAKTQFVGAKNNGILGKFITVLTAGSHLQVFLMPAGNGCVAIKKQITFDQF
jgi:hypothetical protein